MLFTREFLFKKLEGFGVKESNCTRVAFLSDNASNIKAAFTLPHRTLLRRIGCAVHLLNTVLVASFNVSQKSQFLLPEAAKGYKELLKETKD